MEKENMKSEVGSPKYWLSLEQWKNDPEFKKMAEQEFRSSPLSEEDDLEGGAARREFLKLMGASMALASFGCVRRPAQKIVPYANRPDEVIPGLPNYYASSLVDGEEGFGLVVTTREGRPVKLAGNKENPINRGKMSARAHAHILSLYDPDRLTGPKKNLLNKDKTNRETISLTWKKFDKQVGEALKSGKVGLLFGSDKSPSRKKLVADFAKAFGAKTYSWQPADYSAVREANKACYGQSVVPSYDLENADVIVSVGADFLGTFMAPVEMSRKFSKNRKHESESFSKLFVFESGLSLTGANADQRFTIKSSQYFDFLMALAARLQKKSGLSIGGASFSKYASFQEGLVTSKIMDQVADTLWAAKGRAVVMAGALSNEDDLAVQVAVNVINSLLEADRRIVNFKDHYLGYQGSSDDIHRLVADIDSGKVDTVLIYGVNPGYALPVEAHLHKAIQKVKTAVYFGDRNDETGMLCDYVGTTHHSLENWGDAEFKKGVFSVQQPTIRPLYETRSFEDSLISLMKGAGQPVAASDWHKYIKNYWKTSVAASYSASFEDFWIQLLQKGFYSVGTSSKTREPRSLNSVASYLRKKQTSSDLELDLYFTSGIYDGTLANVAWLQEFPDPITKICWDNYLSVSPTYASQNKLKEGQYVQLTIGETSLKVPVHIQPGQNPSTVSLALGYGRSAAGEVANGVGVNAYLLAQSKAGKTLYSSLPVKVKPLKTGTELACTQGHHSMEGRQIVVEATLKQYKKNPEAGIHRHKIFSLWDKHKYSGHKWGMTIDLSSCTGCSACVIACQSENNVPVVGKKYIIQGREMHWMRIDCYYTGTPVNPDAVFMPVVCQHCDNAPCETVCPVVATVHSDEGTNDMIYNRCVGTRYCANNCPYKVRRFNWFDYTKYRSPLHMALNPEVTVRDRGVMEKCSFCKHRITFHKSQAKREKRKLKTDEFQSACQESCPTDAIKFGDLNDPNSEVAKSFKKKESYALLEELNNQPAVRYLTKLRNSETIKSHGGKSHHGGKKEGHH